MTWNYKLTGPLTTPDADAPVRGRVREGGSHNRRLAAYVRDGQGSSALYSSPDRTPDQIPELAELVHATAAAAGNNFAAARDLAELGIPTPNDEPVWTAVLVEHLLKSRRGSRDLPSRAGARARRDDRARPRPRQDRRGVALRAALVRKR